MATTNNNVSRAQEFARRVHDHIRSTTVSGVHRPQIHHIQEVADLVWISGGSDDEITAAWLHDSVEDTDTTNEDIGRLFGTNVAEIVAGLTDLDHFKQFAAAERKKLQAERLRSESVSVRRVKLADQISNVKNLGLDPVNTIPPADCYHYIRGAKLLADECKGISPLLDDLFEKVYLIALERYPNALES